MLCRMHVSAQSEGILITGIIRDRETHEPLPYASVSLKNYPIGTVSSEAGEFSISISGTLQHDTLVVSYVGYGKYTRSLSTITANQILELFLSVEATLLNEVSVEGTSLDANQIIEKAIRSIDSNYPSLPFGMDGFFRELTQQNGKYVSLTEAALKVYDRHFQRRLNHGITEEVNILQARRSIDYTDPIVQRIRKQNSIMDLLDNNPVHYTRGLLNTKYFDYKIDSVFQTQDDVIYIIGTIPGRHRIYVSESNYAILKTIEEIQEADTLKRREFNINDTLAVRRMVYFKAISEFQRYQGKMYLKYSNEVDAYEIFHRNTRKRKFLVESFREFVVTNLVLENVRPMAKGDRYKFNNDIVSGEYNHLFWETSKGVRLSPLSASIRQDLEKQMPLSQQFGSTLEPNHD